mmetsp:Transcript_37613/g.118591  ORF Transcript_37613/g.118591 Transcript_37613/m.118591 type:complete len:201 (-) Transcript_37613:96-698(-)
MPSPLAGAVMTTFLAPAVMCLPAPASSMNTPVPSMTMSMFMAFQGSWRGSREDTMAMGLPSTEMVESSTTLTSAAKVPSMESYLRRWDACLTPPESLMHTTSSSEFSRPCQQRRKLRPMRPKPLMATRSLASVTCLEPAFTDTERVLRAKAAAESTTVLPAKAEFDFMPVNSLAATLLAMLMEVMAEAMVMGWLGWIRIM